MQNEGLKPQNETVDFSKEGYEKIIRQYEEEKCRMWEQSKNDIVGFLYNIPEFLNPKAVRENGEQERIFNNLETYLEEGKHSYDTRNTILCLANDYGIAAEERGFRQGFSTAMRLCAGGMNGGTVL